MPDKGKNMVELTDEQFAAFKMLFPAIPTPVSNTAVRKKERRQKKYDFSKQIEAEFKREYPFS